MTKRLLRVVRILKTGATLLQKNLSLFKKSRIAFSPGIGKQRRITRKRENETRRERERELCVRERYVCDDE